MTKNRRPQPSLKPKGAGGGWWYEDRGGIVVFSRRSCAGREVPTTRVRIHWSDLQRAARRCCGAL